ncbi:MAG: hypothetical protein ACKOXP_07795 [Flavobacteriales bacterium]
MIKYYLNHRLKPMVFLVLACLLALVIQTHETGLLLFLKRSIFLFGSFMAFRLLDDAGSVRVDRWNHPDRIYLSKENFPAFLIWTFFINASYLSALFLIEQSTAYLVTVFWLISVLLYFLFQHQLTVLSVVPLFKYPVLLYALLQPDVSTIELFTCMGSFFILVTYELLEDVNANLLKPLLIIASLFLTGFSFVFSDSIVLDAVFICIPILIYLLFSEKPILKFLPILYYPICMFIKSLLS